MNWYTSSLFVAFVVVVGVACSFLSSLVTADEPSPVAARSGSIPAARKYVDENRFCYTCHDDGETFNGMRDLVLMSEAKAFGTEDARTNALDKHVNSLATLEGEWAKAIVDNLPQVNDPITDKRCWSCHIGADPRSDNTPGVHGVQCQVCHGAAGAMEDDQPDTKRNGWLLEHQELKWREVDAREKSTYGLRNVRDPIARAKLCLSCHLGNAAEGKIVTHEMYVAGHPPLPSIEVESFVEQMPRHWRYLPEKGRFERRSEFVQSTHGTQSETEMPRLKNILVSNLIGLAESARLFAASSHPVAETRAGVDFAAFDCASCHHHLRTPSWRQARKVRGVAPGRPSLPEWPAALTKVGLWRLGGNNSENAKALEVELQGLLDQLVTATTSRPFGDAESIRTAAKPLAEWLDAKAEALKKMSFRRSDASSALRRMLTLAAQEESDFESARQLAWASKLIATELKSGYASRAAFQSLKGVSDAKRKKEIGEQHVALSRKWSDEHWSPAEKAIAAVFERHELTSRLLLDFVPSQTREDRVTKPALAAEAYDPDWFRKKMAELRNELLSSE